MRLISEAVGTPVTGPCANPDRGQVEDYTIIVNDPSANVAVLNNNLFTVYPNPANKTLYIKAPQNISGKSYYVEVFNTIGKLVLKAEANQESGIDLTQLNQGVYLIKITAPGVSEHHKIIKN